MSLISPSDAAKWTPIKQSGRPLIREETGQAQSTPRMKKEVKKEEKQLVESKRKSKIPVKSTRQTTSEPVRRSNRTSTKDVKPGKYAGTC